jgi:hypothetical protein
MNNNMHNAMQQQVLGDRWILKATHIHTRRKKYFPYCSLVKINILLIAKRTDVFSPFFVFIFM